MNEQPIASVGHVARAKQTVPRRDFVRAIDSALNVYAPVRECCVFGSESFDESLYHPAVAAKVVGLAFLGVVAAWEEYLEETFIRYLAGARAATGYGPEPRLGPCLTLAHAKQVLVAGTDSWDRPRHLPWNDYAWVVNAAKVFFRNGEPYSLVPPRFRERLADAQAIRNRVAHSSAKARAQFKRVTNRLAGDRALAPMSRGFSPGLLLASRCPEYGFDVAWLASKKHYWGDFFEAYLSMYLDLADLITPDR